MSPWGVLLREVDGLRRSIRYDLVRRAELQRERDGQRPTKVLGSNRPRRVLAATGVTLVLAGGAAGTYLAVAGGLGLLGADEAGAAALPMEGPAVVLPAGTPAATHPHPAVPRPAPRPAQPARPGGAAAAVVVPPVPVDPPNSSVPAGTPSPTPESTVTVPPSASASPTASPTPSGTPGGGHPPTGP